MRARLCSRQLEGANVLGGTQPTLPFCPSLPPLAPSSPPPFPPVRQVSVDAPDQKGRLDILKVHARNKKFDDELDLKEIALRTPGFSGE